MCSTGKHTTLVGSLLDRHGTFQFNGTTRDFPSEFLALLLSAFFLDHLHLVQDFPSKFVLLPVELFLFPSFRVQFPSLLFQSLLFLVFDLMASFFLEFTFASLHLFLYFHRLNPHPQICQIAIQLRILLGTCEASRFDSNSNRPSNSIRKGLAYSKIFKSNWPCLLL